MLVSAKEMLQKARDGKYAVGQFNINNLEWTKAILLTAQEQNSPVILEFDIVVANILADVIIPMAPVIPARLKKGGYFITSGIIDFKENDVKEAIEKAGLEVVEIKPVAKPVNTKVNARDIVCKVLNDGVISNKKGRRSDTGTCS